MSEGIVFDISRFCLDDGPGIRTTVFLKGCPLRCIWCHNPESNRVSIELGYDDNKCVKCRACEKACPNNCHEFIDGKHIIHRDKCNACGKCVESCDYGALSLMGARKSAEDVMKVVERDKPFFQSSGGGLTISGGEALFQPEFTKEILMLSKQKGISTCIETSGYASKKVIMDIAPFVDLFLYDCKLINPQKHKEYTGVDNISILENLRLIDDLGKKIILRLPLIPGINDNEEHFRGVGELSMTLKNIQYIEIMPYHPLGLSKAALLQRKMPYESMKIPEAETVDFWVKSIQEYTSISVIHAKT